MPQSRDNELANALARCEDRLRAVQRARNLTDESMGRALHVTKSGWGLVRRGKRKIGPSVIFWAPRAFPEVVNTWVFFWAGVGHNSQHEKDYDASPTAG